MLKNNIVSVFVHIGFNIVTILTSGLIVAWTEQVSMLYAILIVSIYTIIILYVYFLCGKYLLSKICSTFESALSVMILSILLIAVILPNNGGYAAFFNMPFYPTLCLIYVISNIEPHIPVIFISLMPSLAMWIGLMNNKKVKAV